MTRIAHRRLRVATASASAVAAAWLLGRSPPRPEPAPSRPVAITVTHAAPSEAGTERLFADATPDAVPVGLNGGVPQLLGIVGRLSAPSAMVQAADGALRTIRPGEMVDGWTLSTVAADRVVFRRGRDERVAVLPPRDLAPDAPGADASQ